MIKRLLKDKRGLTLTEMVVTMLILTLVFGTVVMVTSSSLRVYQQSTNKASTVIDVNHALEQIAIDVHSGMYFSITPDRTSLTLTVPAKDTTTLLILQPLRSDGKPITYYRGDSIGNANAAGSYLWRKVLGVGRRKILSGVTYLYFQDESGYGLIASTVEVTRNSGIPGNVSRRITGRALLRNW